MKTTADELLNEILQSWNECGWGYNPTIKERVEKYLSDRQQTKVDPEVKTATANDGNKIRWFMELSLKMRELGYSDTSIYSIDIDAWNECRTAGE